MSDTDTDRHAAMIEAIGAANGEVKEAVKPPVDTGEGKDTLPLEAKAAPAAPADKVTGDPATSDGTEPPAAPPKKGLQDRFDELTREKYEERRAREAAEANLAALQRQIQAQQQPAPATKAKPTLEQFGYDQDAYEEARDEWVATQVEQRVSQRFEQAAVQRQQHEKLGKFEARITAFEQESPGAWEEVMKSPVQPTQIMREAVAESEVGPKLAYHLAKHLDEAFAISQMPPLQQALAMGRLESKLLTPSAQPRAPAKTVTQALPPPSALPSGTSTVKKSLADETIAEAQARIRSYEANR